MSVIGIDFGNESCYIAVARAGGIEMIDNDYSLRATPTCVAFGEKNRILGVAAKNQLVTNIKNTIYGFKRLLGKDFKDPVTQNELKNVAFETIRKGDRNVGIKVRYLDGEQVYSAEQVTAMMLAKLRDTAESALKTKVLDCVISVPTYFTEAERRSLLDAASVAGLNVLRLLNETTSTALAYGIYKQDLPAPTEKPRHVVFVDFGQSSTQAAACAFHKGKLKILANSFDPDIGGRNFDLILAEHFSVDFLSRYGIDPRTQPRPFLRLLTEVEKLKKQMSANSNALPLNIECFMNDKDVHGSMKRTEMESLCDPLLKKTEAILQKCLEDSGLNADDIHSVEVVGGASRMPALKNLVKKVFGQAASTTLNQDEAVSRGCALQAAILSPAFRVREFSVIDAQPHAIGLSWESMGDKGDMEIFPRNHQIPFSRMLTFFRKEPFTLNASYIGAVPSLDKFIGQYTIQNVKASDDGESQKIKVKVRINSNGIFTICSATLSERATENSADQKNNSDMEVDDVKSALSDSTVKGEDGEPMDETQQQENKSVNGPKNGADGQNQVNGSEEIIANENPKVKKKELPIDSVTFALSNGDLNSYMEIEGKLAAQDKLEQERSDARNALEEYVYEIRGRLQNEDDLYQFATDKDRNKLSADLEKTESWLYEEGEDVPKNIYQTKLADLKKIGEPIKDRKREFNERPGVINDIFTSLQLARKVIDQYEANDEQYQHLEKDEIKQLTKAVEEKQKWMDDRLNEIGKLQKFQTPPVTIAQFVQEKQNFQNVARSIISKPKPKPKTPPPTENKESAGDTDEKADGVRRSPRVKRKSEGDGGADSKLQGDKEGSADNMDLD